MSVAYGRTHRCQKLLNITKGERSAEFITCPSGRVASKNRVQWITFDVLENIMRGIRVQKGAINGQDICMICSLRNIYYRLLEMFESVAITKHLDGHISF